MKTVLRAIAAVLALGLWLPDVARSQSPDEVAIGKNCRNVLKEYLGKRVPGHFYYAEEPGSSKYACGYSEDLPLEFDRDPSSAQRAFTNCQNRADELGIRARCRLIARGGKIVAASYIDDASGGVIVAGALVQDANKRLRLRYGSASGRRWGAAPEATVKEGTVAATLPNGTTVIIKPLGANEAELTLTTPERQSGFGTTTGDAGGRRVYKATLRRVPSESPRRHATSRAEQPRSWCAPAGSVRVAGALTGRSESRP